MTDLDALSALLAAATSANPLPWTGARWLHHYGYGYFHAGLLGQKGINTQQKDLITAAVNALPSLIEAARREAGLRQLMVRLVEAYEDDYPNGGLASALSTIALEARRLLHDNAGAAER